MTATDSRTENANLGPIVRRLLPTLLSVGAFALYASTAAPGTLFGDPSEYQFIPAILGIAHPPGYAFYTLLARLWQILVPVGSIAFRTNLLASAVGAWTVTTVYLITREVGASLYWGTDKLVNRRSWSNGLPVYRAILAVVPLFAALSLAVAPDFWQHAIHANAHIVSAALAITHLWLLIRWWRTRRDRWLAVFAVTLGFAAAHHPITLVGLPAYGVFVLMARPRILRQWRILLTLAGCLLLGLTLFLYYPLRSPDVPFGPVDMHTWDGFLRHVTARGLRVNLFPFSLADQPDRGLVFWSLLRLQFALPVVVLTIVGLVVLLQRAPRSAALICLFIFTHLLFTLNTEQDVMAYLLLPFAALAVAAGVGAQALGVCIARLTRNAQHATRLFHVSLVVCLFPWPFMRATQNLLRGISLRDFTAAEEWVSDVHQRFDGRGEGAVLLSDWEHFTPLMVHAYTQGRPLREEDVELVYASTAKSWPEWVWEYIEEGATYVPADREAVRRGGFRLVSEGAFYRVASPPVRDAEPSRRLDVWVDGRVHILGYDLPATSVRAGQPLKLTLYQRAPEAMADVWMPYAQLGPVEDRWTTDSRLLTSQWQPDEIVVEQYEIPIPFSLPPGQYPLRLGYADLTGGRTALRLSTGVATVELATITVQPNPEAPSSKVLRRALANLDNQVALMNARTRAGWQARRAFWKEPLQVEAGRSLHLTLTWRALARPRESVKVFVHLLDGAGRPVVGRDAEPLGRSCPTYLWFPKWLPAQTFTDPYRLELPADLPPGNYVLEVGMYGATSLRRFPVVDLEGDLVGDRVVLGPVQVE